jgi:uncharacterized protein with HEPN domain
LRRGHLSLLDIVESCEKIDRFLTEKTLEEFVADEILFDAILRNLQNIGEAVRCLPEETRAVRPEIEWTRIVGLRHLLVHHCFGVDEEIVWDLAVNRCPSLKEAAIQIIDRLSRD